LDDQQRKSRTQLNSLDKQNELLFIYRTRFPPKQYPIKQSAISLN